MSKFADRNVALFVKANRAAITVLVAALAIFIGTAAYATSQIENTRESYQRTRARAVGGEDLTRKHLDELAFLAAHQQVFTAWQKAGKIGPTDEIWWIELLLEISAGVDARGFGYKLAERQPVNTLHGATVEHVAVSQLDIRFDFEADHGAAVFEFFTEVRERGRGKFAVTDFRLERILAELPKRPEVSKRNLVNESIPGPDTTPMLDSTPALDSILVFNSTQTNEIPNVSGNTTRPGQTVVSPVAAEPPSDFGGVKVQATLSWLTIDPLGKRSD